MGKRPGPVDQARSFTEAWRGSFLRWETNSADLFVVTAIFPERREEGGQCTFIQKGLAGFYWCRMAILKLIKARDKCGVARYGKQR